MRDAHNVLGRLHHHSRDVPRYRYPGLSGFVVSRVCMRVCYFLPSSELTPCNRGSAGAQALLMGFDQRGESIVLGQLRIMSHPAKLMDVFLTA